MNNYTFDTGDDWAVLASDFGVFGVTTDEP